MAYSKKNKRSSNLSLGRVLRTPVMSTPLKISIIAGKLFKTAKMK